MPAGAGTTTCKKPWIAPHCVLLKACPYFVVKVHTGSYLKRYSQFCKAILEIICHFVYN